MKRYSIRMKLSVAITAIVLLTVALISVLSNYFINRQFTDYIAKQQKLKAQVIQSTLSRQYNTLTDTWNLDYIHTIGMFSIYEGYIIKVYDSKNNILWDAQAHDMSLCNQIMGDISERMRINYPTLQGKFTSKSYPLESEGKTIGTVSISYFGPFFLSDNDFHFLSSLNKILTVIGSVSFLVSLLVGAWLAKKLSSPILKTVEAAKQISDGNYGVRIKVDTNTRELDLLVGSINHLAASLETLEKLRKQMTEDVAHELRTPITILQSYLEAMVDGVWQPTTERMESCYEETIRIGKMVSDLENLAAIESQNLILNKQDLSLKDLIQKTVATFDVELKNKKISLDIKGQDVTVSADKDRMSQVLVNLLSNAVKYSENSGNIRFELFETEGSAGFHITDNGIGIPEKDLPFIFERFYRTDKSRNRLTGGTGIGLTIVKSIVEAHGGTITVESKVDEGTRFTVKIPKPQ